MYSNGYPVGEAILRNESPLLLQVTSTPFYYQPVSRLSGGFDQTSRYFYYTRRKDITLPAEIYRFDTLTLTAEIACSDKEAASLPENGAGPGVLYMDANGSTIKEIEGKSFLITVNGKEKVIFHGNTHGPSPDTRAYAFLSPDCAYMVYFSNYYKLRHVFLAEI